MIRQIIVPVSNTYMLELPNELIGKQVEVLAFGVDEGVVMNIAGNKKGKIAVNKASDIFKDCLVDLTNYKFDRDAANTYK